MTRDLETLQQSLLIFLWVAAVCTTIFPVLWAFSRWWSTLLGRLLMLEGVALALAVDLTLAFQYIEVTPDDLLLIFWLNAIVFGLIALASVLLTFTMIRMNYIRRKRKKETQDDRELPA